LSAAKSGNDRPVQTPVPDFAIAQSGLRLLLFWKNWGSDDFESVIVMMDSETHKAFERAIQF
jgi:hypothetical protein